LKKSVQDNPHIGSSTVVMAKFDNQIDNIRLHLNKITDKNYEDISNKIFDSINNLIQNNISSEDMSKLSTIVFEIATNNRFYSKIYADLYSELLSNGPPFVWINRIGFSLFHLAELRFCGKLKWIDGT
jgi:hypothetical protein